MASEKHHSAWFFGMCWTKVACAIMCLCFKQDCTKVAFERCCQHVPRPQSVCCKECNMRCFQWPADTHLLQNVMAAVNLQDFAASNVGLSARDPVCWLWIYQTQVFKFSPLSSLKPRFVAVLSLWQVVSLNQISDKSISLVGEVVTFPRKLTSWTYKSPLFWRKLIFQFWMFYDFFRFHVSFWRCNMQLNSQSNLPISQG